MSGGLWLFAAAIAVVALLAAGEQFAVRQGERAEAEERELADG